MILNTAPKDSERMKAFELYLSAGENGRRTSYRSIAQKLGVHEVTVRRWARVDKWQERLNKNLGETAQLSEATNSVIKRRLRQALLLGLEELEAIIGGAEKDADRINAIKAVAEIAAKAEALGSNIGASGKEAAGNVDFKDDIKEADEWQLKVDSLSPSLDSELTSREEQSEGP